MRRTLRALLCTATMAATLTAMADMDPAAAGVYLGKQKGFRVSTVEEGVEKRNGNISLVVENDGSFIFNVPDGGYFTGTFSGTPQILVDYKDVTILGNTVYIHFNKGKGKGTYTVLRREPGNTYARVDNATFKLKKIE